MVQARFEEVRDRYRYCVEEARDPLLIAEAIAREVGMCDDDGNRFSRPDGAPCLNPDKAARKRRPQDYPLDMLAEAIIGRDWRNVLGLGTPGKLFPVDDYRRQAMREGLVQEESAAPIGPSMWANVAAWSSAIGGLLGAQFNLGYESAPYDVRELFPIRPAVFWQGGERYIDIIGPYQPAQATGPGEEYPDNDMSAMWVEPGQLKKYAGKVTIAKETAEIDISGGQIMAKAAAGGDTLAFRENELTLDVICGQTNNFKLGMRDDTSATAYNTYGPTITNPQGTSRTLTNDNVNPFNDPGAMEKSDEYLAGLYHPVTDFPIDVNMSVALFPTPMAKWAMALNGAATMSLMNQGTANMAQQPAGTFPSNIIEMLNPWRGLVAGLPSRWLHTRHVASTTQPDPNRTAGLGLTGAAVYRWYRIDPTKAACRRQKWAANSQSVSPNDWVMLTQGLIGGFVWDLATMIQVLSPYHIQRNKGS